MKASFLGDLTIWSNISDDMELLGNTDIFDSIRAN